jgi:hypothetical protein
LKPLCSGEFSKIIYLLEIKLQYAALPHVKSNHGMAGIARLEYGELRVKIFWAHPLKAGGQGAAALIFQPIMAG